MSALEIIGAGTVYVVAVIAAAWCSMFVIAAVFPRGGLATVAIMSRMIVVILVLGAAVGLVLLGRLLH